MWVKKSQEEKMRRNDEKWRNSPSFPIIFSLGLFFIGALCFKVGCHEGLSSETVSMSWEELWEMLPGFALICLSVGILLFLAQKFYWDKKRLLFPLKKVMICMKCEKSKWEDNALQCSCGGNFEDLETLKWVDR